MRTFYHGTTVESAMQILKNGFAGVIDSTIWNVSDADKLYMRELNCDEDGYDESLRYCIENAQIAAAIRNSMDSRIAVIKFIVDDKAIIQFDEMFESDDSCDNMEDCFQVDKVLLQECIDNGTIKASIDVYDDAYVPYLRVFYLAGLEMSYLDIEDNLLIKAIEIAKNSNVWLEEILDCGEISETFEIQSSNSNIVNFTALAA